MYRIEREKGRTVTSPGAPFQWRGNVAGFVVLLAGENGDWPSEILARNPVHLMDLLFPDPDEKAKEITDQFMG